MAACNREWSSAGTNMGKDAGLRQSECGETQGTKGCVGMLLQGCTAGTVLGTGPPCNRTAPKILAMMDRQLPGPRAYRVCTQVHGPALLPVHSGPQCHPPSRPSSCATYRTRTIGCKTASVNAFQCYNHVIVLYDMERRQAEGSTVAACVGTARRVPGDVQRAGACSGACATSWGRFVGQRW